MLKAKNFEAYKVSMFAVSNDRLGEYIAFLSKDDAGVWVEENGGKINEIMADYKQYIFLTGHDLSLFDFVELAKTFKS